MAIPTVVPPLIASVPNALSRAVAASEDSRTVVPVSVAVPADASVVIGFRSTLESNTRPSDHVEPMDRTLLP